MSEVKPIRLLVIGGPSAVGKDTFIDTMKVDSDLCARLGCGSRVCFLSHSRGREVKERFPREVEEALEERPDAVVLKWQAFMKKGHFAALIEKYPGLEIAGIFLCLDVNEHAKRLYKKHKETYGLIVETDAIPICEKQSKADLRRFRRLGIRFEQMEATANVRAKH